MGMGNRKDAMAKVFVLGFLAYEYRFASFDHLIPRYDFGNGIALANLIGFVPRGVYIPFSFSFLYIFSSSAPFFKVSARVDKSSCRTRVGHVAFLSFRFW